MWRGMEEGDEVGDYVIIVILGFVVSRKAVASGLINSLACSGGKCELRSGCSSRVRLAKSPREVRRAVRVIAGRIHMYDANATIRTVNKQQTSDHSGSYIGR